MTPEARKAFILAHTRLLPVPNTPEICLHLADEATALWQKTEDELGEMGLPPPFWAFAWAGGQALARYVIDHPEILRHRRVLDFASGSGLVGIAAVLAGAGIVEATDLDPFAGEAIALNAEANRVNVSIALQDVIGIDGGWDVILAGDICYERETAARVIDWLGTLHRQGTTVLIGDPGRTYLPKDRLVACARYEIATNRSLEDQDIKRTQVWRFKA